jgi:membrane metallo-endopeptidase-like protein 1
VDKNFPEQNRQDVEVMINNVLSAFSSSLSGLIWMDNPSALMGFHKVAGLVRNVAYPDFQQTDAELDAYYRSFIDSAKSINSNDPLAYYHYVRALTTFINEDVLRSLKRPTDRTEFGGPPFGPALVNAWYQPERNSITFPAAILNEPFYRYDFPQAVNYGALGVVMGHELSHGFDDQGVQYDYDGTLNTWMTPVAEGGFKRMAQCVVDEYGRFCYPPPVDTCINGVTTQGENIGDNGGLKAAYRAYKSYTASHGEEMPLPGLETYTMDQIFFLSYAYVWCGSYSDDTLLRQLLTNPHSPGKDRIIGAVQNFPKFAEAFKCKKGDPMYPTSACDVW